MQTLLGWALLIGVGYLLVKADLLSVALSALGAFLFLFTIWRTRRRTETDYGAFWRNAHGRPPDDRRRRR